MKTTLVRKLETLSHRYQEVGRLLGDPILMEDQNRYRDLGREYAQLEPLAQCFQRWRANQAAIQQAEDMCSSEHDVDLHALAEEELERLHAETLELEQSLQWLLLPKDPNDERNVFLEIRAGTGGDEAAIFSGDLFRMYSRYAEGRGWRLEVVSAHAGEHGGYKEIIARIIGQGVYSQLKFESGAHRVQRVPTTESQGRIHTSACTVAVMPEVDEVDAVEINPNDLRIDTYRSSGAGGQHVNKTDSAIRMTHLPTGIVVECQDERSQHKNRARALSLLQAKLLAEEQEKQRQSQAQTRKSLVGSGDRSERIRTYNFPQGRITDHRINLTLYQLDEVMEGSLDDVIQPLVRELRAEQLAALSEDH